jgi:chemotaxis signal transduction protein
LAELDNDVTTEVTEVLPEEELRVCLFTLGGDTYAIPVEFLTEIIISRKIFSVPTTPSHVLGVINLRGSIVPIVDIRLALSLLQLSVPGQIAIVKYGNVTFGLVVDNVSEVVGVSESSVRAIPSDEGTQQPVGNRDRFLLGTIERETGEAALLNIERVFEAIKLN